MTDVTTPVTNAAQVTAPEVQFPLLHAWAVRMSTRRPNKTMKTAEILLPRQTALD